VKMAFSKPELEPDFVSVSYLEIFDKNSPDTEDDCHEFLLYSLKPLILFWVTLTP
jgi:hypothetical protein